MAQLNYNFMDGKSPNNISTYKYILLEITEENRNNRNKNNQTYKIPIGINVSGYCANDIQYNMSDSIKYITLSKSFKEWYIKTCAEYKDKFQRVDILNIYPFNINSGAGFLTVNAKIFDENNKPIPGYCFLRGNSVAVLPLIRVNNGESFSVITLKQSRTPIGQKKYVEIPAGMMDDSKHFGGTAVKEMYEETGIKIHEDNLIPLNHIHPSPGGCDERIALYLCLIDMTSTESNFINNRITGNENENENIIVDIKTYKEFIDDIKDGKITDSKAISALSLLSLKHDFNLNDPQKIFQDFPDKILNFKRSLKSLKKYMEKLKRNIMKSNKNINSSKLNKLSEEYEKGNKIIKDFISRPGNNLRNNSGNNLRNN